MTEEKTKSIEDVKRIIHELFETVDKISSIAPQDNKELFDLLLTLRLLREDIKYVEAHVQTIQNLNTSKTNMHQFLMSRKP